MEGTGLPQQPWLDSLHQPHGGGFQRLMENHSSGKAGGGLRYQENRGGAWRQGGGVGRGRGGGRGGGKGEEEREEGEEERGRGGGGEGRRGE